MTASSGWFDFPMRELFSVKHGFGFDGKFFAPEGNYILLTPGNFHDEGGFKYKKKEKFFTGEFDEQYLLPKNTLIVAMTEQAEGLLGSSALIPESERFLHNQRIGVVADERKDRIDIEFLYYLFNTRNVRSQIRGSATGTKVRHTSPTRIGDVKVTIPNVSTQRKIASTLSAYDELIKNNTRRITILEVMAQALYQEWFVNFHFPGHENINLVDSPLGQIPLGWVVNRLDEVVIYQSNGTKAGEHLNDRVYLPIDCLTRRSLAVHNVKSWEEAKSSLHLFDEGDILFGAMRPYFHKVVVAPFNGVTRKTCFVFKPKLDNGHAFATLTLFQESTIAFANAHSRGSTIPYAVWKQGMDGMHVVSPPSGILKHFEQIVQPMLDNICLMYKRNRNLRQNRDLLFHKLMSGKLDVENLDIETSNPIIKSEEVTI
jgi:type I restriction enzyme, S subunit